jgi:formylglycine-generating enzyme required for sulfatase activity
MILRTLLLGSLLLAAPPASAAKYSRVLYGPVVVLTPAAADCAAGRPPSDRCRALAAVASAARLGALAAIDGRDVGVMSREEATSILALRLFPAPCAGGERCSAEAARDAGGHWFISGAVAPAKGRPGAWAVELELRAAGSGELLATSAPLAPRGAAELRSALLPLAEAMVRAALEPDPLGRRSRAAAEERASDVLVAFEAPQPALVKVDGRLACMRTPCARRIAAGAHEATFGLEGFDERLVKFEASEGAVVAGALTAATGRDPVAVVLPGWPGCEASTSGPGPRTTEPCERTRGPAAEVVRGARAVLAGSGGLLLTPEWIEFQLHVYRPVPACGRGRDCALETARAVGARWLLTGVLGKGRGTVLELREVESGRRLAREVATAGVEAAARSVVRAGLGLGMPSARVGAAPAATKKVRIGFDSEPEQGAAVSLDGRLLCTTPCAIQLPQGERHEATFDRLRFAPATATFETDRERNVTGTLSPDFGWVGVHGAYDFSSVDVAVRDGRHGKRTPRTGPVGPEWGELEARPPRHGEAIWWREVDAGEVEIVAERACYLPIRQRIPIAPGEIRDVRLDLHPRSATLEVHAWDEEGRPLTETVWVDGLGIGTTGKPFEAPICGIGSMGRAEHGARIVSVHVGRDTFAKRLVLREGSTVVVEARPGPPSREGTMVEVPGWSEVDPATQRTVGLAPFQLDATEVTVRAYARCVDDGTCTRPPAPETVVPFLNLGGGSPIQLNRGCTWGVRGKEDHPVNCVTWDQAVAYCAWEGKRLPSDVEWEWAARGAERAGRYPPGADKWSSDERACVGGGSRDSIRLRRGFEFTCRVGAFPLGDNVLGIQDLEGNVSEWTTTVDDPDRARRAGQRFREPRVVVGSSWRPREWDGRSSAPPRSRPPTDEEDTLGFRCAKSR